MAAFFTWARMLVTLARPSHSTALSKWTFVLTTGRRNRDRVILPGACGSFEFGSGPKRGVSCGSTVKSAPVGSVFPMRMIPKSRNSLKVSGADGSAASGRSAVSFTRNSGSPPFELVNASWILSTLSVKPWSG